MPFSLNSFRLDGRVAIVTGAGGRGNSIGRAYALGLAAAGAAVLVADLSLTGAESVAAEIVSLGGRAAAFGVDVSDRQATCDMTQAAMEIFGGIDILVNNAALMVEVGRDPCETITLDDWRRVFAVNLDGALLCAQAVIPAMRARGGGRIVNQVSGGAFPPASTYGISKLALVGLTTALAKQLGGDCITVNAIAPGNVMSDAGRQLVPDGSAFIRSLESSCPIRPRGEPDDLVGALLLLCSEAGGWITGQTLHVDGGWVMRP